MLKLQNIGIDDYPQEKERIFALVGRIWTREESAAQAKHSIDRWGTSRTESGIYFYITQDSKPIGITGYFIPDRERGVFGLRHHGTTVRGAGFESLNLLTDYLSMKYKDSFRCLAELVPEGREDLIPLFEKWGFKVDPEGVPDWEPKRDYYKYYLVRGERE